MKPHPWLTRRFLPLLAGLFLLTGSPASARFKKDFFKPKAPDAKPAPRSALLNSEAWLKVPMTPIQAGEIDQLVAAELASTKVKPAPLTTDEQFIRRVSLDLTGQLPLPADVREFVADPDSRKRAKLIDKLLDSEAYAHHWAVYWRDVISAKVVDRRGLIIARQFEDWLADELKKNASWGSIVKAMLTASGTVKYDQSEKNGAAFFLAAHQGTEAANDRAAETSRIFLGIQIQCAQCHNHPFDQWKQVQFHEFAGYFARLRERPVRDGMRIIGIELIGLPGGEHEMVDKDDPKKSYTTHPRFLDGGSPGKGLSDRVRRESLAEVVIDKTNYWFAGAYVNRMWGEMMGQSFYQPVDDMGPLKDAVFPEVLTRLAAGFRATNYDMKGLFRTIMNSETYQRQIRLGESTDEHLHFAASYPKQLPADALWQSLVTTLGQMGGQPNMAFAPMGAFGFRLGLEGEFKRLFAFDPSLKADEVEGSIPQALLLMNNPTIDQKIKAEGNNLLGRILKSYPEDKEALEILYLRALARKPSTAETAKCLKFIAKVENRAEAFEDILWALINSTEFQSKR